MGYSRDPARDAVCSFLSNQADRFPMLDLHPLVVRGVDARDEALGHAIADAAIRRWLTLAHLLRLYLDRPLEHMEPHMRGVLLCGAAQIVLLSRVPAYAAIDHAVSWAKTRIRPGAGGMANAVLRRVADMIDASGRGGDPVPGGWGGGRNSIPLADGSSVPLREPVLPEEDRKRLVVATSVPSAVLKIWEEQRTVEQVRHMALHSIAQAPIVLNTSAATAGSLDATPDLVPHETAGHHVFTGSHTALTALLANRREIWAQDVASAQAVKQVADRKPGLIIDLCAGQGTKTRQLATVFPNARIVATDSEARRVAMLADVFKGSEKVTVDELIPVAAANAGKADLVLLDVPCSNTAVLARRPEAKYRLGDESIGALVGIQREILRRGREMLSDKPGAAIVYSTCSADLRENQAQARWAAENLGLREAGVHQVWPAGGPGQAATAYSDGAFSVVLERAS